MFNIQSDLIVPYNTEQMFVLVNDISSYSDFVPGCIHSCILVGGDFELTAQIDIFKFGMIQSFITHNFMVKNKSIMIKLLQGPCKSLFGSWKFIDLTKNFSKIECCFYYEFTSKFFEKMFGSYVEGIIQDVIHSFILRAGQVYK